VKFVIQEHLARSKHYDFRLEVAGAFRSWAVPKGLPTEAGQKRLAVQTADHSIAFGSFVGRIPDGLFGAGQISIWDSGDYDILGPCSPQQLLDGDMLEFRLRGHRIQGAFRLFRPSSANWRAQRRPNEWLFMKLASRQD
jgi:bifunctional non-homologous end joining protein LigD